MVNYIIDADAFGALNTTLQAEYKKRDSDGKYVLDVVGAVPQEKLKEFRENNTRLMKELEAFADVDPAKYAELLKIETDLRNGKVKDGKTVEEIVAERTDAMKKSYEKEKTDLAARLGTTEGELAKLKISDAAVSIAAELGLRASAKDDLVARVTSTFRLKDGKPLALDPVTGAEIYGQGAEPLSIKEYVGGLVEKAPHLFEASSGTGATGNNRTPGAATGANPWKQETWNLTRQGEIFRTNPDLAKKMAADAGKKLPGA